MLNINIVCSASDEPSAVLEPCWNPVCSLLFLLKTRNIIRSLKKANKDCTFLMVHGALCSRGDIFVRVFLICACSALWQPAVNFTASRG